MSFSTQFGLGFSDPHTATGARVLFEHERLAQLIDEAVDNRQTPPTWLQELVEFGTSRVHALLGFAEHARQGQDRAIRRSDTEHIDTLLTAAALVQRSLRRAAASLEQRRLVGSWPAAASVSPPRTSPSRRLMASSSPSPPRPSSSSSPRPAAAAAVDLLKRQVDEAMVGVQQEAASGVATTSAPAAVRIVRTHEGLTTALRRATRAWMRGSRETETATGAERAELAELEDLGRQRLLDFQRFAAQFADVEALCKWDVEQAAGRLRIAVEDAAAALKAVRGSGRIEFGLRFAPLEVGPGCSADVARIVEEHRELAYLLRMEAAAGSPSCSPRRQGSTGGQKLLARLAARRLEALDEFIADRVQDSDEKDRDGAAEGGGGGNQLTPSEIEWLKQASERLGIAVKQATATSVPSSLGTQADVTSTEPTAEASDVSSPTAFSFTDLRDLGDGGDQDQFSVEWPARVAHEHDVLVAALRRAASRALVSDAYVVGGGELRGLVEVGVARMHALQRYLDDYGHPSSSDGDDKSGDGDPWAPLRHTLASMQLTLRHAQAVLDGDGALEHLSAGAETNPAVRPDAVIRESPGRSPSRRSAAGLAASPAPATAAQTPSRRQLPGGASMFVSVYLEQHPHQGAKRQQRQQHIVTLDAGKELRDRLIPEDVDGLRFLLLRHVLPVEPAVQASLRSSSDKEDNTTGSANVITIPASSLDIFPPGAARDDSNESTTVGGGVPFGTPLRGGGDGAENPGGLDTPLKAAATAAPYIAVLTAPATAASVYVAVELPEASQPPASSSKRAAKTSSAGKAGATTVVTDVLPLIKATCLPQTVDGLRDAVLAKKLHARLEKVCVADLIVRDPEGTDVTAAVSTPLVRALDGKPYRVFINGPSLMS